MSVIKLETIYIPSNVVTNIGLAAKRLQEYFRSVKGDEEPLSFQLLLKKRFVPVYGMPRQNRHNPYSKGCYNSLKDTIRIYPLTRCFGLEGIASTLCHEVAHALDPRLREDDRETGELIELMKRHSVAPWECGKRIALLPSEVRAEATALKLVMLPCLAKAEPAAMADWIAGGRMPRRLRSGYTKRWSQVGLEPELRKMATEVMERVAV